MSALGKVFLFKMVLTVGWALGPLLLSPEWMGRLGFPPPQPVVFLKLLGAAFVALFVVYSFAVRDIRLHRKYPMEAVWVGIVSNAGACVVLTATSSIWSTWEPPARRLCLVA